MNSRVYTAEVTAPAAKPQLIEGEYEVVEAAVDAAPRGPGGAA